MAGRKAADSGPEVDVDLSALGRGTFEIPGVGLVVNGKTVNSDDPKAIAKYHENDLAGAEQASEAMAERDADIVALVAPVEVTNDKVGE